WSLSMSHSCALSQFHLPYTTLFRSWPGLDSPLVQPGPTICVGACAGPVVWGPAERGRLVVACDMTSDTCSDGRKITTTRSTPVRSEEHTSELQSRETLVCRLLLEKK